MAAFRSCSIGDFSGVEQGLVTERKDCRAHGHVLCSGRFSASHGDNVCNLQDLLACVCGAILCCVGRLSPFDVSEEGDPTLADRESHPWLMIVALQCAYSDLVDAIVVAVLTILGFKRKNRSGDLPGDLQNWVSEELTSPSVAVPFIRQLEHAESKLLIVDCELAGIAKDALEMIEDESKRPHLIQAEDPRHTEWSAADGEELRDFMRYN